MKNPAGEGGVLASRSGRSDVAEFTRKTINPQAACRAIEAGFIALPDACDAAFILRRRLDLPQRVWLGASAMMALDAEDAEALAEAVLDDIRAGAPPVWFWSLRDEAREWAFFASPGEVKTYFSACWHRLPDRDQRGFLRAARSKARPS